MSAWDEGLAEDLVQKAKLVVERNAFFDQVSDEEAVVVSLSKSAVR